MSEIIMPKMGDAMTEGKVVQWYKSQGDVITKGEPVLEIETDKVNLDLEAEEDGVLGRIAVEAGSMVPVGQTLAVILQEGDAPEEPQKEVKPEEKKKAKGKSEDPGSGKGKDSKRGKSAVPDTSGGEEKGKSAKAEAGPDAKAVADSSGEAADEESEMQEVDAGVTAPSPGSEENTKSGFVRSSPLARKMAKELGVEITSLSGSGPAGRIVASDVKKAAESGGARGAARVVGEVAQATVRAPQPSPKLEEKVIPLTAMRRTIAKRLAESLGPIPHFFLTVDLDVTNLLSLRKQFNELEGVKVSVNDFVVRAVALALTKHPEVNSSFEGEAIRQHGSVHVGIAVSTPEGLITPVIRDTPSKSIPQIAGEVRQLAEKARNRKLKPDEYQGSTFTISNLGMFGIEEFTAIINPPNSAILAVGAAEPRPVVVDGQIVIRDRMKSTMSCDHRVIDGAAGAAFLKTFRSYIEQPLRLIV